MARQFYGGRSAKQSGGGVMVFLLILAGVLVLRYGESERLVSFRQSASAYLEQMNYEEAIETLGSGLRTFREQQNPITAYSREILGFHAG